MGAYFRDDEYKKKTMELKSRPHRHAADSETMGFGPAETKRNHLG